jgi:hypothetical protein
MFPLRRSEKFTLLYCAVCHKTTRHGRVGEIVCERCGARKKVSNPGGVLAHLDRGWYEIQSRS